MTPNICSYRKVRFSDTEGINDRFALLFKNVCYLLSNSSSSGVSQIIAGTGITISPSGGTGNVTINAVVSAIPTLDQVVTAGNVASNAIFTTSLKTAQMEISTPGGFFIDNGAFTSTLDASGVTASSVLQLPDVVSGTLVVSVNGTLPDTHGNVVVSGGGGSPGGSNTQIQYNNSGAFGATSFLTYQTASLATPRVNVGVAVNDPSLLIQSTFLVTNDVNYSIVGIQASAPPGFAGTFFGNDNHSAFLGLAGSGYSGTYGGTSITQANSMWLYNAGHTTVVQGSDIFLGTMGGSDYNLEVTALGVYIGQGSTLPSTITTNALSVNSGDLSNKGAASFYGSSPNTTLFNNYPAFSLSNTDQTANNGVFFGFSDTKDLNYQYGGLWGICTTHNAGGSLVRGTISIWTYNGGGVYTPTLTSNPNGNIVIGNQSDDGVHMLQVGAKALIGPSITDPLGSGRSNLLISDITGEPIVVITTDAHDDRSGIALVTDGSIGHSFLIRRFASAYGGTIFNSNISFNDASILETDTIGSLVLRSPNIYLGEMNGSSSFINMGIAETGIVIDTTGNISGSVPDSGSIFQVKSTVAASIPYPLMTNAQMNAIVSPAVGCMVYVTDLGIEGLYINKSSGWTFIA